MTDLHCHVQDYLRMRRALGFKLAREGQVLPQLVDYLHAAGTATLTTELAIAWAGLPVGVAPVTWTQRLGAARGFASYLQAIDPWTEIPPTGVFAGQGPRPTPFLWSDDDIVRLLDAAGRLQPRLRAVTYQALFGLLAVTGMRIGEALALGRDDVDLDDGVVLVRDGKFHRQRLLPLHPTTTDALRAYTAERDRLAPETAATTFLLSWRGRTALGYGGVSGTFKLLTTQIGLRTDTAAPRVHDLRHSFAVRTLIDWHRADLDVAGRLPALSDYLGHVSPSGTYWYLSAVPELMELAAARLDGRFGAAR